MKIILNFNIFITSGDILFGSGVMQFYSELSTRLAEIIPSEIGINLI